MPTKKQMSDAVKIALISAICSVITALITALVTVSVQWRAAEKQEQVEHKAEAKEASKEFSALPKAGAGDTGKIIFRPLSARVEYNEDGKSRTDKDPSEGSIEADICLLTTVSSYGGASKSCSLTQTERRWSLVSTGRKATSTCQAICFDLPKFER